MGGTHYHDVGSGRLRGDRRAGHAWGFPDGGDAGFGMLPPLMAPPISPGSGWSKRKNPKYEDLAMGLEVKGTIMPRNPSAG